jgi:hypothetical protein
MTMGGYIAECRAEHRNSVRDNLVTLFRSGMSQSAICREVGMGADSLRSILREAGVVAPKVAS